MKEQLDPRATCQRDMHAALGQLDAALCEGDVEVIGNSIEAMLESVFRTAMLYGLVTVESNGERKPVQ